MAEHVLDVMHGPAGFEQARARFVPQIVEVQIDRAIVDSESRLSLVLPLSFGPSFFFQTQTG